MSRPGFRVSDQLLQNIVFPGVTCNVYGSISYFSLAANLSNIGTITADRVIAGSIQGSANAQLGNGTTGVLTIGCNSFIGTYTVTSNLTLLGVGALGGSSNHGAASNAVIIGQGAGFNASNTANSVLIGKSTGATVGGPDNVIIGRDAKYTGTGASSVVVGAYAASNATSVDGSVIIGPYAAQSEAVARTNVFIVNNTTNYTSNALLYGLFANGLGGVPSGYYGRLGVNCIPGSFALDVEAAGTKIGFPIQNVARFKGDVLASNYNTSSDIRLKTQITAISGGISMTCSLNPVTYVKRDDPSFSRRFGFIAQELMEVMPEAVTVVDQSGSILGIAYQEVIPVLTKAIQELAQRVQTLEARLSQPSS